MLGNILLLGISALLLVYLLAALADAAQLASLADETPEGRSIVVLAKEKHGLRGRELASVATKFIPFSAATRMSGVDPSRWIVGVIEIMIRRFQFGLAKLQFAPAAKTFICSSLSVLPLLERGRLMLTSWSSANIAFSKKCDLK
jgi:hypothetical protein